MINVFDAWRTRRLVRKTQAQLNGLSDQILADIGISRDDIASMSRNGMPQRFEQ